MGSCGRFRLLCSGFREIFQAFTEFRPAQGDDGVCALYGTVDAGAFEPGVDHTFTTRLHAAARGAKSLLVKLSVSHSAPIIPDVSNTIQRHFAVDDTNLCIFG